MCCSVVNGDSGGVGGDILTYNSYNYKLIIRKIMKIDVNTFAQVFANTFQYFQYYS